jgi:hypothetical protein
MRETGATEVERLEENENSAAEEEEEKKPAKKIFSRQNLLSQLPSLSLSWLFHLRPPDRASAGEIGKWAILFIETDDEVPGRPSRHRPPRPAARLAPCCL